MRKLLFGLAALFCTVSSAQAQNLTPHTITVTGQATIMAAPDFASISMGVISTAPTTAAAAQENNAVMTRVVNALSKVRVPKTNVQTNDYNVEAMHPFNPDGMRDDSRTTGYRVANKVTVTVSDVGSMAKVIDAATLAGANTIDSINFSIKDRTAVEDEARTAAVRNARHQAEVLASADKAKITKMIAMTTVSVESGGFGRMYLREDRTPATPILPGRIPVSAQVTVQFSVE